jgi:hypothetical protein
MAGTGNYLAESLCRKTEVGDSMILKNMITLPIQRDGSPSNGRAVSKKVGRLQKLR